ncbi:MAG: YbfB/YjiJ family MFS transporter [Betaproteobacteria bacterium]|nr:YbfB/YjiJ family MFS transporter [Betaproteobacteria bacterium]MDH4325885.1 YbfB/YjiJ family MFS transporter [Betaproteobacteria bacterium]
MGNDPGGISLARGLLVAFLLSFGPAVSNSFARFAYALILPAMRADLEWSYSQAGSINTVNAFGYLLGALLTRALLARAGNRALYAWGMVITSVAIAATGFVRGFEALMAVRVLAGVGGAAVFICGGALSGNIFPQRPRLAATTIAIYFAGGGIGLMLSGVAVPLLLEAHGSASWPLAWRAMGYASLLMTVAAAWAAWRIAEPGKTAGEARWTLRPFAAEFAAYALFALGYIGYMTFVIAWMRLNGASTAAVIAVWFVLGLATLLAPLVWRKPAEHWPGGRPLAAVMAVLAAGAALPLASTQPAAMLLSAALFGVAMFSAPSSIGSFIQRALPRPAWGSAIATFTAVFAAGQIAGPVAIGWLADRSGSLQIGLAASAALLALGAALALAQRDLRHRA